MSSEQVCYPLCPFIMRKSIVSMNAKHLLLKSSSARCRYWVSIYVYLILFISLNHKTSLGFFVTALFRFINILLHSDEYRWTKN